MLESEVFVAGGKFALSLTSAFEDRAVDCSAILLSELVARTADDSATAAPTPELMTVSAPLLWT
jgi:hypothetical protein